MDISRLPRYPIHDEALPSHCERLLQKDATELWPSIAVVVATCLILVVMTCILVFMSSELLWVVLPVIEFCLMDTPSIAAALHPPPPARCGGR